ncbi:MAG: 50S ribosomal protein L24 [Candidatus Kaiserbacteria bacterium]|nr:50S ribosomal protein L24 [Candidatus Kaiserbacteria bacterium]
MKIRKGDTVIVLKGSDRGKTGVVSSVVPERETVIVEGLNMKTVHMKPRLRNEKGTTEKRAMPIAISNVSYFDKKSKKQTRIGYAGVGKEKKRVARADGAAVTETKEAAKKKTKRQSAKKQVVKKKVAKKKTGTAAKKKS